MHLNTSTKINVVNIDTSTSVVMDSNTLANIDIPHINMSTSVEMHENTSAKPHLEYIETPVMNYKYLGDSCSSFEHVDQD